MDRKEFELMVELRKDSRRNLTDIGKRANMPVSTVHDRIKRIKAETIRKFTCILDFRRIGFNCRAHVVLRLHQKEDREQIKEYLLKHQNINSVYKINNGYDFLTELVFRDISELDRFLDDIEERYKIKEKKVYYIIEDIAREVFLSDRIHAGLLDIRSHDG